MGGVAEPQKGSWLGLTPLGHLPLPSLPSSGQRSAQKCAAEVTKRRIEQYCPILTLQSSLITLKGLLCSTELREMCHLVTRRIHPPPPTQKQVQPLSAPSSRGDGPSLPAAASRLPVAPAPSSFTGRSGKARADAEDGAVAQGSAPSRKEGGPTVSGLNAPPRDLTDAASLACSKVKVQQGITYPAFSVTSFWSLFKNKWLINTSPWFYF